VLQQLVCCLWASHGFYCAAPLLLSQDMVLPLMQQLGVEQCRSICHSNLPCRLQERAPAPHVLEWRCMMPYSGDNVGHLLNRVCVLHCLQEDAPAPPPAAVRPAAAGSPPSQPDNEDQQQQQPQQDAAANGQASGQVAAAAREEAAAPPAAAAAPAEGGWVEAGAAQGLQSAPAPAPLQNIKFKLRL
jgi:hypothetical protein